MNKKGFAISIIMYSLVFLIISIFYILLGIYKTRYTVTSNLRESIMEELNESNILYDKIERLGKKSNITYVQKYNKANGTPIDTPDGTGDKEIYYYTTTSNNRNSDAEQNSNVIFGNYCWQIVRTTADGGVKLIYNGLKTNNNKCSSDSDSNYSSNPRPSSIGTVGTTGARHTTVSGNKLYGTSFEIFDDGGTNKFRLKNTFTANWNGDYDNDGNLDYPKIIGTFSCLDTNSTCTTLYYVGHYQNSTQASTEKYTIGTNEHYSQIGSSSYNAYLDSPAVVGYMYNNAYTYKSKTFNTLSNVITRASISSYYFYGDTATWVTDHYELTTGGVTPTTTSSWASIRSSAKGLYTCKSATTTSCTTVHYIVANSSNSYMYSVPLSNNEQAATKSVTWTIGTGYTGSNGNYSLTGTSTLTILLKDWYEGYNNSAYKNFYICDNKTSGTCTSEVYYVGETSEYQISYNSTSNPIVFANDVEYVNGEYKLILNDPTNKPYQSIWDWYKNNNTINNTHYTCFGNYDAANNTCGGIIYYVYFTTTTEAYYITLSNNTKIEDAMQQMLNINNSNTSTVNKYNSAVKGVVDSWYESNLSTLESYLDNDAVFCNDRTVTALNGWAPTGGTRSTLFFKYNSEPSKSTATLSCTNITDRFSSTNTKAELTYPIGLLSEPERVLMSPGFARTGKAWWLGSPSAFYYGSAGTQGTSTGTTGLRYERHLLFATGIRPVIVLRPGIEVIEGKGTYNEPYIIDDTIYT